MSISEPVLVAGGSGFLDHFVRAELRRIGVQTSQIKSTWCATTLTEGTIICLPLRVEQDRALLVANLAANFRLINTAMHAKEVDRFIQVIDVSYLRPDVLHEILGWALVEVCEAYRARYEFPVRCLLLPNLYGPGDAFRLGDLHVVPTMVRKIYDAKMMGEHLITLIDGSPMCSFLHVEDAARAVVQAADMDCPLDDKVPVRVQSRTKLSTRELVSELQCILDCDVEIKWESGCPTGQPWRRLATECITALEEFEPRIGLGTGLREMVDSYVSQRQQEEVNLTP